jgi:hypothetical protein
MPRLQLSVTTSWTDAIFSLFARSLHTRGTNNGLRDAADL